MNGSTNQVASLKGVQVAIYKLVSHLSLLDHGRIHVDHETHHSRAAICLLAATYLLTKKCLLQTDVQTLCFYSLNFHELEICQVYFTGLSVSRTVPNIVALFFHFRYYSPRSSISNFFSRKTTRDFTCAKSVADIFFDGPGATLIKTVDDPSGFYQTLHLSF